MAGVGFITPPKAAAAGISRREQYRRMRIKERFGVAAGDNLRVA
jgi:hypothetical protein